MEETVEGLDKLCVGVKELTKEIGVLVLSAKDSTGDTQNAYRLVVKDKIWSLTQLLGQFYRTFLDETVSLEREVEEMLGPQKPKVEVVYDREAERGLVAEPQLSNSVVSDA